MKFTPKNCKHLMSAVLHFSGVGWKGVEKRAYFYKIAVFGGVGIFLASLFFQISQLVITFYSQFLSTWIEWTWKWREKEIYINETLTIWKGTHRTGNKYSFLQLLIELHFFSLGICISFWPYVPSHNSQPTVENQFGFSQSWWFYFSYDQFRKTKLMKKIPLSLTDTKRI